MFMNDLRTYAKIKGQPLPGKKPDYFTIGQLEVLSPKTRKEKMLFKYKVKNQRKRCSQLSVPRFNTTRIGFGLKKHHIRRTRHRKYLKLMRNKSTMGFARSPNWKKQC